MKYTKNLKASFQPLVYLVATSSYIKPRINFCTFSLDRDAKEQVFLLPLCIWSPDILWYQHSHFIFKFVLGTLEISPKEVEERRGYHNGSFYPHPLKFSLCFPFKDALDVTTKNAIDYRAYKHQEFISHSCEGWEVQDQVSGDSLLPGS